MEQQHSIQSGLEGVIAAETKISAVNGLEGILILRGFPLESFVQLEFEEAAHLILWDVFPEELDKEMFQTYLEKHWELSFQTKTLIKNAIASESSYIDVLRMGVATLENFDVFKKEEVYSFYSKLCSILVHAIAEREKSLVQVPGSGKTHAQWLLETIVKADVSKESSHALECYWKTVMDHGFNNSTFTARSIVSTGSDLASAITGAIGSLKGPLHGGAPGPALQLVHEARQRKSIEVVLREKLDRGERLMGFGHRIYKTYDPRAAVLKQAAEDLYMNSDDKRSFYLFAKEVEETAIELLQEYKPGRELYTNVEFYTALLLHGLGLHESMFTAIFALGRSVGWMAHCIEQKETGRLIRPKARYVGPLIREKGK